MFQSYSFSNGNKYTIIDSDFQEVLVDYKTYFVEHIIEIYSRRNLNVAKNIVLFMQHLNKKYPYGNSIDNQISLYKGCVKDFDKYIPEINKYLSLI